MNIIYCGWQPSITSPQLEKMGAIQLVPPFPSHEFKGQYTIPLPTPQAENLFESHCHWPAQAPAALGGKEGRREVVGAREGRPMGAAFIPFFLELCI